MRGVWTTKYTKCHERRERAFVNFVPFREFRDSGAQEIEAEIDRLAAGLWELSQQELG